MDGSRPSTPFDNHGSPHLVTAASMYVSGPFFPPPSRPGPPTPGAGGGDLESDASRQTRPPQFLLPRNECLLPLPRYTSLDRIKHSPSHHPHTPFSPRRHGRENITGNHQGDHQGEREKNTLAPCLPMVCRRGAGRQASGYPVASHPSTVICQFRSSSPLVGPLVRRGRGAEKKTCAAAAASRGLLDVQQQLVT